MITHTVRTTADQVIRYGRSNRRLINSSRETQKNGISTNRHREPDRIVSGKKRESNGKHSAQTVRIDRKSVV